MIWKNTCLMCWVSGIVSWSFWREAAMGVFAFKVIGILHLIPLSPKRWSLLSGSLQLLSYFMALFFLNLHGEVMFLIAFFNYLTKHCLNLGSFHQLSQIPTSSVYHKYHISRVLFEPFDSLNELSQAPTSLQ